MVRDCPVVGAGPWIGVRGGSRQLILERKQGVFGVMGTGEYMNAVVSQVQHDGGRSGAIAGFSLVEMAMVLVIVGLLLGTMLSLLTGLQTSSRESATRQHMVAIKQALQNYYASHGRLPCPAVENVAFGLPTYGVEAIPTPVPNPPTVLNACVGPVGGVNIGGNSYATHAYIGAVPWQTLGLSRDLGEDSYDLQIDYVVMASAVISNADVSAQNSAAPVYQYQYSKLGIPQAAGITGALTVVNTFNNNWTGIVAPDQVLTTSATVVLISHGANAFGAATDNGTASPIAGAGAAELVNAQSSASFAAPLFATGDIVHASGGFDDIVDWMLVADVQKVAIQNGSVLDAQTTLQNEFQAIANGYFSYLSKTAPTCRTFPPCVYTGAYYPAAPPAPYPVSADFLNTGPYFSQPFWTAAPSDCLLGPLNANVAGVINVYPVRLAPQTPSPPLPAAAAPFLDVTNANMLDPWGKPILYARGPQVVGQPLSGGQISSSITTCANPLALLSFGPDGVQNPAGASGDDVSYFLSLTTLNNVMSRY